MMKYFFHLQVLTFVFTISFFAKAYVVDEFAKAKKFLNQHLEYFENKTIYCSCAVIESGKNKKEKKIDLKSCGYKIQSDAKRAARLEWEHVVPAEAFGQSFKEWREGDPQKCVHHGKAFKGRKCAKTNPEFSKMEGDYYNLYPEIGELNGLRSNYSMAELTGPHGKFGKCMVKLEDRKFEPQDQSKGIVARNYLNFENRYPGHGVVSEKNQKLFEAWNKMYPLTEQECRRWKRLEKVAGYTHLFAKDCRKLD